MKKVVLLGDSIRIQYAPRVKELLSDICEVYTPEANCAYTMFTIWNLHVWMAEMGISKEKVDLIHYNNGIWEHHRTLDDSEPLTTPELYLTLNRRLYKQLKKHSDKLIWATTIPSGENYNPNGLCKLPRSEWDCEINMYNGVLASYLVAQGVEINDLYSLIGSDTEKYIGGDGIHLSESGIEAAAQQVAAKIRAALTDGQKNDGLEAKLPETADGQSEHKIVW